MNMQFYQFRMKENKVMLAISYLTDKTADWIQFYINRKFHFEDSKNKKNEMFSNYDKFVNKIIITFKSVNFKRETE